PLTCEKKEMRFTNKVALITGGGTGIGRATAEAIIAQAGKVVIIGRREEPLAQLQAQYPNAIRYTIADITSPDGPTKAFIFAIEQFGQLNVLVNNAGSGLLKPLDDPSDEDIDRVFDTNIKGAIRMIRDALPHLIESRGAIVNVSSTLADYSVARTAIYSASKAAMQRLTKTLAVELGPMGVRINAVSPGITKTGMEDNDDGTFAFDEMIAQTPLRRLGEPEDIARAITFLASDEARWITGQIVQSSGGFML